MKAIDFLQTSKNLLFPPFVCLFLSCAPNKKLHLKVFYISCSYGFHCVCFKKCLLNVLNCMLSMTCINTTGKSFLSQHWLEPFYKNLDMLNPILANWALYIYICVYLDCFRCIKAYNSLIHHVSCSTFSVSVTKHIVNLWHHFKLHPLGVSPHMNSFPP